MAPIGRIYETEAQARVAMEMLQDEGFAEDVMTLVPAGTSADAMPAGVPRDQAITYARRLEGSYTLLLVSAGFGWGARINRVMDACGPVWTGDLPVTKPRNPAPFSKLFGMPTLSTRGRSYFSRMFPELASPGFHLSEKFGMKLLSRKEGPWEKSFGMKLLSRKEGPWEKSFGIKLLSRKEGPWEKSFGFPLLLKRRR